MTTEKKQLLDKTFQSFMQLGLSGENMNLLDDMVAKDVVGFGTTIDEKIFGVKEMRDLLIRQKEQSAGIEMNWKINTLDIHISVDENTAIYTNEIILYITVDSNPIEMYMRFSVVLEYVQQKWMVVHWHGSKPEHVESEKDTWGIETWKERAEALEKEVAARTADLVEKNRELKVEAALERVRAISLAMHHTSELQSVIHSVHQELLKLNLPILGGSFIAINSEINDTMHCWGSGGTADTSDEVHIPRFEKPFYTNLLQGIKKGPGFFTESYTREEKIEFFTFLFGHEPWSKLDEKQKEETLSAPGGYTRLCTVSIYTSIFIINHSGEKFSDDDNDILKRFGKVFEQSYTRFLDLQKAEAQAKEAQIEAALERVRSKTMSMHNSNDVGDSVATLFDELTALGLLSSFDRCGIGIMQPNKMMELWTAEKGTGKTELTIGHLNMQLHTLLKNVYQKWLDKEETYQYILQGEDKFKYYEAMRNQANYKIRKDYYSSQERIVHTDFFFKEGCLYVFSQNAFTTEATSIFIRFVNVFGQTYRRYLDLQKAEAQAREAQIEAALERVRSRSMAMHKSEELRSVVSTLYGELQSLQVNFQVVAIQLIPDNSMDTYLWLGTADGLYDDIVHWPYIDIPVLQVIYRARTSGEILEYTISGGDTRVFFDNFFKLEGVPQGRKVATQNVKIIDLCGAYQHLTGILLLRYTEGSYSPYEKDIVNRFSKAFEQTYTRFLDLQKAEAQAREAQIENALEKVRSRSLAMQNPAELNEVAQLLREEMGALGVEELETSSIYIHDESSGKTQCWFTIKNADNSGKAITDQMTIDLHETWVGQQMYDFYNSAEKQISIRMQGLQRIEWIRYCEEKSDLFGTSNFYGDTIPERTYHLVKFSNGFMGAAAPGEISKESRELLKRATAVFSFAYTRFRDLQMAEASARASLRQASLDRVRADISSMRHADDLNRITPLVFNELTTLGIPFIRCGVFIVHEKSKSVQVYLSTPEGKSLAAMNLPFNANELTTQSVAAWKREDVFIQHWNQADFMHWGKSMQEQGHVKDLQTYQDAEAAPESLHLHFVPFAQGLLYVGSTETLAHEQIDLVKALAKSFAIAYARYEDFVKLERAKAEVEAAMGELKATQSQLVQQEKLASLGQLTAGIAHEIKNPLNFVNNFSEVSLELIDESLEEMNRRPETRDETIVNENLAHIKSNIIKVLDHGTRANSIVNSMLMHSRTGTGRAELTMLNDFIREYSNLAYHGMRAGNHPLDVQMNFNLDERVKEVPLIAEDFSRVVLNICNNAFDACAERSRSAMREKTMYEVRNEKYEVRSTKYEVENTKYEVQGRKYEGGEELRGNYVPTLSIQTKLENGKVLIQFEDNGPGISDEIRDKILQPFFTTKKGTEGTGLGLSITNDIVKAHGGALSVETEEGKGSKFIIQIPINTDNG